MSDLPFQVSTQELTFSRKKSLVRTIEIGKTNNFNNSLVCVRIHHNLPKCFQISAVHPVIAVPCSIDISYDPDLVSIEKIPRFLYIKFDLLNQDGIQVLITFAEEQELPEALQCQICLCQFDENNDKLIPRLLTGCGHTLCDQCVRTLQKDLFGALKSKIVCPFDRKTTNISTSSDETGLPRNRAVLELLSEMKEMELAKNLEKPVFCDDPDVPCYENSRHEATCYCTTCKVELCDSCFRTSHSSRVFFNHRKIPIDERPVISPNCHYHPENVVHYICKDSSCLAPNRLFCDDCHLDQHRCHEHLNYQKTVTENLETLEKTIKKLENMESKFRDELQKTMTCAQSYDESNQELQEKVGSITKYFNDLKNEALEKLERFVNQEKVKLSIEGEEIEENMKKITETRIGIQKKLKQRNNIHDAQKIFKEAKELYQLVPGSLVPLTFFSSKMFPDDMSNMDPPVKPLTQREIVASAIDRRIAKARRKKNMDMTD